MNPIPSDDGEPASDAAPNPALRVAVVAVGDAVFGLPADSVREVVPARPLTPLPTAPASVLGLMNHRGRIVTVVDLAALLDRFSSAARSRFLLVDLGERRIGLAVDDVVRIAALQVGPASSSSREEEAASVKEVHLLGSVEVEGWRAPLLDIDALLHPIFEWRSPTAAALRQE